MPLSGDLRFEIDNRFRQNGVNILSPQLDVHIRIQAVK